MRVWLALLGFIVLVVGAGCGESIPRIEITEVTDNEDGSLTVSYLAKEFSSADIDITASYSTPEPSSGPATPKSGTTLTAITTSDSGVAHTFVWDYKTDLGIGRHKSIAFTITPYGPDGRGRAGVVGPFHVGLPVLFTVNQNAGTISVVDIAAGQVSSTTAVGPRPKAAAALPDESKLYVTNSEDDTVSIVNIDDPTLMTTLTVGATPLGIAVSPDGESVYVVNSGDGTVSVIDPTMTIPAVVDAYAVGATPVACSLTEDGQTIFVTNSGDNTVSILLAADGSALMAPISVGSNPQGIATGSRYTVVCNYDSGTVSIIDNASIVAVPPQVAVDSHPVSVVVDAKSEFAYVANYGSDSISVVNLEAKTVVATIDLSTMGSMGPRGLALDGPGEYLWVTYANASKLAKIEVESRGVLTSFTVGSGPVGVVILSK
jgi:YVTN family beta-propeller protein